MNTFNCLSSWRFGMGFQGFSGGCRVIALLLLGVFTGPVQAGPRGSELDLTLTPAAGGMEGVGVVRPQDPVAMIFGNPATLTQLRGSNAFTLGASFISPNLRAKNEGPSFNPFVAPDASGKSRITALAMPHVAALHRITPELVSGFGFTGISGLGSDFRSETGFPDLIADLKLFGGNAALGYQVTPRFNVGATFTLGIGSLQAGLVQNSASVNGFGVGGTVGATYDFGPAMIGVTYKSPLNIKYDKVIETSPGVLTNLTLEQPQDVTFGVATTNLLGKDTLVEVNYRFKDWSSAKGYRDFWKDQHVVSLGVQHAFGKITARAGYSYSNKLAKKTKNLGDSFGQANTVNVPGVGVVPVSPAFIQAAQATITDGYWRQSASVGLGFPLTEQVRLDFNGSYAFDGSTRIGGFDVRGRLWTAGMGATWNF